MAFFVEKDEGDWDVYLKGSEFAKYLGYTDTDQAISEHVEKENKCKYSDLCEFFDGVKNTGLKIKVFLAKIFIWNNIEIKLFCTHEFLFLQKFSFHT